MRYLFSASLRLIFVFLVLLGLGHLKPCWAQTYITTKAIHQKTGDKVSITVQAHTLVNHDTNYTLRFYNSDGDYLGFDTWNTDAGGSTYTFGPYYGVDQSWHNIDYVEVWNEFPSWPMVVDSISAPLVGDADVKSDSSGLSEAEAKEVSPDQILYGALVKPYAADTKRAKFWKVHLEKGETISEQHMFWWADYVRDAHIWIKNPYDPTPEYLDFPTNGFTAPTSGTYYIQAFVGNGLAYKISIQLTVTGRQCPPPYTCPCSLDQGAKNFPVELSKGRERSYFDSDLDVYNPVGPSVSFERSWLEALALDNTNTAGLARGWTHSYDMKIVEGPKLNLLVYYPSGGIDLLTAQIDGSMHPTGPLSAPLSAPYTVSGQTQTIAPGSDATHQWSWIEMTWDSGTKWRFVAAPERLQERYLYHLDRITTRTGQYLQFAYNTSGALSTIKNQAGTILLTLTYANGKLVSIGDLYGRRVDFAWNQPNGLSEYALVGVSQMENDPQATAPTLNTLGYVTYAGIPLLNQVSSVQANGGNTPTVSTNTYDSQGRVASTTDGNGNQHIYTYGSGPTSGQTDITVKNSAGTVVQSWTKFYDSLGRDTGYSDSFGHRWTYEYINPNSPTRPNRIIDPMGRIETFGYDAYGHLASHTSPNGVSTLYDRDYTTWVLGRLTGVRIWSPTPPTGGPVQLPATTFTYYEPSGLVASVTAPHPNGTATGTGYVTTTYSYDSYGNVTQVVAPGNAASATRTTNYYYTTDGTYTQSMMVGNPIAVTDNLGHSTHLRYNTRGDVLSSTDAMGVATNYVWYFTDQLQKVQLPATGQTGPGQGEVRYSYGYRGGPVAQTQIYDEAGNAARTINSIYGYEGELLYTQGNVPTESYQYDAMYRVVGFIDGANRRTNYAYDSSGRLTEITYPGGTVGGPSYTDREVVSSYDASGLPLQTIDGRGQITNFGYLEPNGQLTSIQHPSTTYENVSLSYDIFGRLSQMQDYTGSESYTYTDGSELATQTTTYKKADGTNLTPWTQTYYYNADGSRAQLSTSLGNLNWAYDAAGRMTALQGINGTTTYWNYLNNDWLSAQQVPVGVRTSYNYNAQGQTLGLANERVNSSNVVTELLSQWGTPPALNAIGYNGSGQMNLNKAVTTATYPFGGQVNYSYDSLGRLSGESNTRGLSYTHTFAYDGAGNPTTWKGATRTFNANNQETTGGAFGYNGDGTPWKYLNRNLANASYPSGQSQVLSYNTQGQLRQINAVNTDGTTGAVVAKYGTRGDGKRGWKSDAAGNRTYFYYDGDDLFAWTGESAGTSAELLWGPDGVLGQQSRDALGNSSSRYFLYDANGNLAQYVGGDAVVHGGYAYTAWGESVPKADGSSAVPGAFGYGAKYGYWRDGESGFYICTYRSYDPGSGRFITRDPIGFNGGSNLYAYTGNDPVNNLDPSGLNPHWGDYIRGLVEAIGLHPDSWFGNDYSKPSRVDNDPENITGADTSAGMKEIVDRGSGMVVDGANFEVSMCPVGGAEAKVATEAEETTKIFSARELIRRVEEPGAYHNFPDSFDNVIFKEGVREVKPNYWRDSVPNMGNDSINYTLPGKLNGKSGTYEIFTRPSASGRTEVIMHRFFQPDRTPR